MQTKLNKIVISSGFVPVDYSW